ncbi:hypothetical protein BD310DRAFT_917378 [Dichomitus squalens]|uniref:Uncharacterized protein n=1 Tax=Dichomitus squalens TaxID=114155 RepID=A0A4Q9Q631_9APHY|nr:hypothetical protein BD310DRAFT_917378 [Dichomitus squalens]
MLTAAAAAALLLFVSVSNAFAHKTITVPAATLVKSIIIPNSSPNSSPSLGLQSSVPRSQSQSPTDTDPRSGKPPSLGVQSVSPWVRHATVL